MGIGNVDAPRQACCWRSCWPLTVERRVPPLHDCTLSALRCPALPLPIVQAQSALQDLLPRSGGMAVDYAGAIDVLEVLQGVLDDDALLALDCFK